MKAEQEGQPDPDQGRWPGGPPHGPAAQGAEQGHHHTQQDRQSVQQDLLHDHAISLAKRVRQKGRELSGIPPPSLEPLQDRRTSEWKLRHHPYRDATPLNPTIVYQSPTDCR